MRAFGIRRGRMRVPLSRLDETLAPALVICSLRHDDHTILPARIPQSMSGKAPNENDEPARRADTDRAFTGLREAIVERADERQRASRHRSAVQFSAARNPFISYGTRQGDSPAAWERRLPRPPMSGQVTTRIWSTAGEGLGECPLYRTRCRTDQPSASIARVEPAHPNGTTIAAGGSSPRLDAPSVPTA